MQRPLLVLSLVAAAAFLPLSKATVLGELGVLHRGQVAAAPVPWEKKKFTAILREGAATRSNTFERVARSNETGSALAAMQARVKEAVDREDYKRAASLQQEMGRSHLVDTTDVADEVWHGATHPLATNETSNVTADVLHEIALAAWGNVVQGESSARTGQLDEAEALVKQVLARAAHLGHGRVSLAPIDDGEDTQRDGRSCVCRQSGGVQEQRRDSRRQRF